MAELGARIAAVLEPGVRVFLVGALGSGKTTLVRGILRALGVSGTVRSPTYTLVEPYETDLGPVLHVDLYRLTDPRELETLGMRDYFDGRNTCLLEWPERGGARLGAPDLTIALAMDTVGRRLRFSAQSPRGEALLAVLCR